MIHDPQPMENFSIWAAAQGGELSCAEAARRLGMPTSTFRYRMEGIR